MTASSSPERHHDPDGVTPGTDGYSHVLYCSGMGVGWVPQDMSVQGNYIWKIELYAANGSGWNIQIA